MSIVNRNYLKLVLLYVYGKTAQYCGDSDNRIRVSKFPNHAEPKSKVVPPCSAQTR